MKRRIALTLLTIACWMLPVDFAAAHHVLGRPASSLNEDSNTPSALQGDAQIGDYTLTYMVFPAFPRPGAAGRINLYVRANNGTKPFQGKVSFKVSGDTWLSKLGIEGESKTLGIQQPDDHVYRQSFTFGQAGDYIITAEFEDGQEPYRLDFPLRIGDPAPIGPTGLLFGLLALALITVGVAQRRRSMTGKIREAHDQKKQR